MAPTERLVEMVREAGITKKDFGRQANEEVILLSRKRKIGDWWDMRIERDWIDYTDTPETNAMRDAIRRINGMVWSRRLSPSRTTAANLSMSATGPFGACS